jgi:hypothetical protein
MPLKHRPVASLQSIHRFDQPAMRRFKLGRRRLELSERRALAIDHALRHRPMQGAGSGPVAERLIEGFDRDRRRVDGVVDFFGYAHGLELAIKPGASLCRRSRFRSAFQGKLR